MGATIGHIILAVSRLKESALFYDPLMKSLGFEVGLDNVTKTGGIKSYHSGSHSLFLKWRKNSKHRPFNRDIGLDHLAFKVKGKTKVDEVFRLVSKSKAKVTIPPKSYPEYSDKYYAFYFRDPDGIPLEVATY